MFSWYRQVTPRERKTFWACFGGWSLDALGGTNVRPGDSGVDRRVRLTKGDAGCQW